MLGGAHYVLAPTASRVRPNEHARGVRGLGGACVTLEPPIERGLAAAEPAEAVVAPERLRAPVRHRLLGWKDARLGEELLEPGLVLWRTLEQLDETRPLLGLQDELCPIGQHTLGFDHRRVDNEVGQRSGRGLGRLPDELSASGATRKSQRCLTVGMLWQYIHTSVRNKSIPSAPEGFSMRRS